MQNETEYAWVSRAIAARCFTDSDTFQLECDRRFHVDGRCNDGSGDDGYQPLVMSKNSKTLGFDSGLGNHLFNNFVALHVNKGRARRL